MCGCVCARVGVCVHACVRVWSWWWREASFYTFGDRELKEYVGSPCVKMSFDFKCGDGTGVLVMTYRTPLSPFSKIFYRWL